jgi:lipopolysaccharide biosynthesis glycosyltransferase
MNDVPLSDGQASEVAPLTVHIALCCNGTMLPGLHATVASLVKNLSRRETVSLNLFIQGVTEAELLSIRGTILDAGGVGALTIHEADISDFKNLKALQGDWMAYLRLHLPKLMPDADTILYLDSDLIVNTDACAIFEHKLDDSPFAAVDGEPVEWNLDRHFLKSVGLTDNDRTFNSGVLLFNAELWRKTGLVERSIDFGRAHSTFLRAADQTILTGLFSRDFSSLPNQLNIGVYVRKEPLAIADGIYHFIGSPKPWDPLGRIIHRNWRIWHGVIRQTKFKWSDFLSQHGAAYAARAWTLRRSYLRTWLGK